MSHTPGPWHFSTALSGSENHKGFSVCQDKNSWILARVMPLDEDGNEGKANARLIAAAPEMLEALREVLAAHDNEVAHDSPTYTNADAIRAAIAKATGAA